MVGMVTLNGEILRSRKDRDTRTGTELPQGLADHRIPSHMLARSR